MYGLGRDEVLVEIFMATAASGPQYLAYVSYEVLSWSWWYCSRANHDTKKSIQYKILRHDIITLLFNLAYIRFARWVHCNWKPSRLFLQSSARTDCSVVTCDDGTGRRNEGKANVNLMVNNSPFRISGTQLTWIGVGFFIPNAWHCFKSQSLSPRDSNPVASWSTWSSSAILLCLLPACSLVPYVFSWEQRVTQISSRLVWLSAKTDFGPKLCPLCKRFL